VVNEAGIPWTWSRLADIAAEPVAAASEAAAVVGTVVSKIAMLASALIPSELPWTFVSPRVKSGTV